MPLRFTFTAGTYPLFQACTKVFKAFIYVLIKDKFVSLSATATLMTPASLTPASTLIVLVFILLKSTVTLLRKVSKQAFKLVNTVDILSVLDFTALIFTSLLAIHILGVPSSKSPLFLEIPASFNSHKFTFNLFPELIQPSKVKIPSSILLKCPFISVSFANIPDISTVPTFIAKLLIAFVICLRYLL